MEKKMNTKHHGKHGARPRPRDAFELYEREHMPGNFIKASSDYVKSHDFGTEKFIGLEHGQQRRHRPRDAFELYELEHMPRTFVKISSGHGKSRDFAKPRDLEVFKPDYHETGRTQWRPTKDAVTGNENIDAEAENFIASKHKKFELSKLMSMNGC